MSKVSIVIPSRNERFLVATVKDLLTKASGDIEVIPVLDGYWEYDLPTDKRIKILHKGSAEGMRPAINDAIRMSTGQFILKLDAHCSITQGYDERLIADHAEDNWIVVPRRDRLDAENWCLQVTGKPPIDAHYLSNPLERLGDTSCGLHGTIWNERARKRRDVLIDEEMSSQGSCWFTTKSHWNRIGEQDVKKYGNFIQEFQEMGLKTWLGGGKVMVNKNVTYLHLHKGPTYGRGYSMAGSNHKTGKAFAEWYWMTDQWEERVHNLKWFIERFWPVPSWPKDLDKVFFDAKKNLRNPWN